VLECQDSTYEASIKVGAAREWKSLAAELFGDSSVKSKSECEVHEVALGITDHIVGVGDGPIPFALFGLFFQDSLLNVVEVGWEISTFDARITDGKVSI